ncbi:MAG: hypothetical protein Kilf2KO_22710 [Rhodospirillales bacterium]
MNEEALGHPRISRSCRHRDKKGRSRLGRSRFLEEGARAKPDLRHPSKNGALTCNGARRAVGKKEQSLRGNKPGWSWQLPSRRRRLRKIRSRFVAWKGGAALGCLG